MTAEIQESNKLLKIIIRCKIKKQLQAYGIL